MISVHQFFLNNPIRNFNYLVEMEDCVFCVDPFDEKLLAKEIQKIGKPLKAVVNTHEHWDHVKGNREITNTFQVPLLAHENCQGVIDGVDQWLTNCDSFESGKDKIIFQETPGHTMGHMSLYLYSEQKLSGIVVGDTVFVAGVGNCHNGGDPETLFQTIHYKIRTLEESVKIYTSHDYAQNNLRFTLKHEPGNAKARELLDKFASGQIDSTKYVSDIKTEKEINCFFRYDSEEIRSNLNMKEASDKEVFLKLRELRNNW